MVHPSTKIAELRIGGDGGYTIYFRNFNASVTAKAKT